MIVDRLLRKTTVKAPTITEKAEPLNLALVKVAREHLTGCTSTQYREECRMRLTEIKRTSLNDEEFNAFVEAEKQGYRAVGDER